MRKSYYIDRKFQGRFIRRFSIAVIFSIIFSLLTVWLIKSNPYGILPGGATYLVDFNSESILLKKTSEKNFIESSEGEPFYQIRRMRLHDAFDIYWIPLLLMTLVNLGFIILFSVFFSHKFAGPLYRIRKTLESIIKNEHPGPIRLRKGDELTEIADLLNKTLGLYHVNPVKDQKENQN